MLVLIQRNFVSSKNVKYVFERFYCKKPKSVSVTPSHYDIIIAGGGMIGTTLASTLGQNVKLSNRKILLLEGSKELKWKPAKEYSNRVSALSPGTRKLLDSIGAWKHISAVRYGPVKRMQVWDGLSDAMIAFNKDDMSDVIACIVENDLLLNAVKQVLTKNVTVLHEAKIKDCQLPKQHEDTVKVEMEDGKTYTCKLLLGCDGANSKVRHAMGVHYVSWNYEQMGVVATLRLSEKGGNNVAWQRFLPTGPIALLPLNDDHSSLVWTTTPKHAQQLLKMPMDKFVDEINNGLWKTYPHSEVVDNALKGCNSILETLNLPSNAVRQLPPSVLDCDPKSRAAFPLAFGHASNYVAKGVALVGDAAHRVHPLAGQGVNLGFGDVSCLNGLLSEAVYAGKTLGSLLHLKQYESERQRHNLPTMLAIDGLQKLYGTESTPVVVLRSVGLQITHALAPLKNFFTAYASK